MHMLTTTNKTILDFRSFSFRDMLSVLKWPNVNQLCRLTAKRWWYLKHSLEFVLGEKIYQSTFVRLCPAIFAWKIKGTLALFLFISIPANESDIIVWLYMSASFYFLENILNSAGFFNSVWKTLKKGPVTHGRLLPTVSRLHATTAHFCWLQLCSCIMWQRSISPVILSRKLNLQFIENC